jgi:hypothetical protein
MFHGAMVMVIHTLDNRELTVGVISNILTL